MTRVAATAALTAASLIALTAGPARAGAPERSYRFEQPALPLSGALLAVSARSGTVIVAPAELTAPWRAPALSGVMSLPAALRLVLADTELDFAISGDGVVRIRRRPPPRLVTPVARPLPVIETLDEPTALTPISVVARPLGEPGARDAAAQVDLLLEDEIRRSGAASIGDAMAQLPGVSTTVESGEARQIGVRGVGGRFMRVRVNGMETLATFGGANAGGGTNRGRGFDYNVFAADLFKQVRLQKSASADLDEGSLGATVDMRTRSPLDMPERSASVTVEGSYLTLSGKARPRVSAVLSRRDAEGRLGVLVSAAFSSRVIRESGTSAGQWESGDAIAPGFGASTASTDLATLNAALHARIPRLELVTIEQERMGLSGSLEWRPSAATRVAADLIYARLRTDRTENLLESFTLRTAGACAAVLAPSCGINAVTVTDARVDAFGGRLPVLIAGAFDNVDIRSEARSDQLNTIFRQATVTATHEFDGGVKAGLLVGFSRSDFSNPVQQTLYLEQFDVDGFAYDFSNRKRPDLRFGNADLSALGAWTLTEFRSDPNWVDNSFKTLALDFEGPLSAFAWRAGFLHKAYRTEGRALSRTNGGVGNANNDIPPGLQALPLAAYAQRVGQGVDFGVATAPKAWLALDTRAAIAAFRAACPAGGCTGDSLGVGPAARMNYSVSENADAAYAQLALPRSDRRPFWGEVGVRLVRTRQRSASLSIQPDASLADASASGAYWNALPSANLALEVGKDAVLRFGMAKVIAWPDLMNLRPGVGVSTIGSKLVWVGNPDLGPTRATTYDVSLDWRPSRRLLLSAALYAKDIDITTQLAITRPTVFSANPAGLPDSVAVAACGSGPGCSPALPIWQFARPINAGPGRLSGAELAFRAPLSGRASAGWTLQGAVAYTRTSVRFLDKNAVWTFMEDALGAPRITGNFGVLYRKDRLDARATVAHRGRYIASIPAPNGGDVDGVDPFTSLDVGARLAVSERLTLTADGFNLTNARQRQYSDRTLIPTYQHRTGREFRIGVRWDL